MIDKPAKPPAKPTAEEESLDKEIMAMFAAAEAEVVAEGGSTASEEPDPSKPLPPQVIAADGTAIPLEPVSDATKKEWAKLGVDAATTAAPQQAQPAPAKVAVAQLQERIEKKSGPVEDGVVGVKLNGVKVEVRVAADADQARAVAWVKEELAKVGVRLPITVKK